MRTLVFMLASMLIVACGDAGNSQTTASAEVDFCTCVNEPMTSNARVKVCKVSLAASRFPFPRAGPICAIACERQQGIVNSWKHARRLFRKT